MGTLIRARVAQCGMSLVEVLFALSIIAILAIAGGLAVDRYAQSQAELLQESSRLYVAEGGMEMVRFLRDSEWDTIAAAELDTPQYLAVSTSSIALVTDPQPDPWGERSIVFSAVYRDDQERIVPPSHTAAVLDPESRLTVVTVTDDTATSTLQSMLIDIFR